jgi:UDP-N-acetylglucosamine--N-acetylmuramyl-(pentapeptide) pyrophosphoryl-undecaprenol N-acetylglucosamine transferase
MAMLKKILIMAGGTGGHVFPGLAVASHLKLKGVEVHWLGTAHGLEASVIPAAGLPLHYIAISGLRGKSLKDKCLLPFKLLRAIIQAAKVIVSVQPDLVLGMGGFVSGPGGIASWLLRKPLLIHEQNAKAGLTNRWLSRFATKTLEGFPTTFPASFHAVVTGNPVRDVISNVVEPALRFADRSGPMRLLVLGGSLGAQVINQIVPKALALIPEQDRPLVYHQTGEKHLDTTLQAYQASEVAGNIVPFIASIEEAYSWADLVLCRAGALTVSELCAVGLGAVLVPYPFSADDHQTANATFLVKNNAGILIQQADLTGHKLAEIIELFVATPNKRMAMANAAYELRKPGATDKVLKYCEEALA